jgi:hypothetical protein
MSDLFPGTRDWRVSDEFLGLDRPVQPTSPLFTVSCSHSLVHALWQTRAKAEFPRARSTGGATVLKLGAGHPTHEYRMLRSPELQAFLPVSYCRVLPCTMVFVGTLVVRLASRLASPLLHEVSLHGGSTPRFRHSLPHQR